MSGRGRRDAASTWRPYAPGTEGPGSARLSDALERVLAGLGSPAPDLLGRVQAAWPDLVGADAATALRPVAIEHGRLLVVADEPAWAGHVRWLEADVVRRCDALLGPGVVQAVEARAPRSR